MNPAIIHDLFRRAISEELGVVITTNNPHAMGRDLHLFRKDHPEFASIEINIPSTPDTIMLVKKSVELDEPVWDAPSMELEQ